MEYRIEKPRSLFTIELSDRFAPGSAAAGIIMLLEFDLLNFPPPYGRNGNGCYKDETLSQRDEVELHPQEGESVHERDKEKGANKSSGEIRLTRFECCSAKKAGRQHEQQELLPCIHDCTTVS